MVVNNFPELILDNYPFELLEAYPYDLLMGCPEDVLKSGEFKLNFKEKVPNEFISKDGRKIFADVPFEVFEDMIIGLEFHSYDIDYERETIFNTYQAHLHKNHHKHVFTIVFSLKEDSHKIITHKINAYDGFTMLIISLKALNQKQTLNNSLYKISNNISMSDKEKALFLLSPMMDLKNKMKALNFMMDNFYKINDLSQKELEDMETIIWLYIEKWCKKEFVENDGGVDMATLTPGAKKIKEEILNQGIEKGIEEERFGIISSILSNGLSFEEVSRLTGVSVDEISKIAHGK